MSKEEREWIDHNKELNWIDRLVSDRDKAKTEATLSNKEFLTSMEMKHSFFTRSNRESQGAKLNMRVVKQLKASKSC